MDYAELTRRLRAWAAKGPKASRRRYVRLAEAFLSYARARGARDPSQIGRRLAYEWIGEANHRMRYYSVRLVWVTLQRPPLPRPSLLTKGGGSRRSRGEGKPSPRGGDFASTAGP